MPPRSPAARAGPVRGLVPPPARHAPCLAAIGLTPSRRTSMHLLGQGHHAALKVLGAGQGHRRPDSNQAAWPSSRGESENELTIAWRSRSTPMVRIRRDARFLHVDVSMSDGTADRIEVPKSRRSSRPSMRRTKRSFSLSLVSGSVFRVSTISQATGIELFL